MGTPLAAPGAQTPNSFSVTLLTPARAGHFAPLATLWELQWTLPRSVLASVRVGLSSLGFIDIFRGVSQSGAWVGIGLEKAERCAIRI